MFKSKYRIVQFKDGRFCVQKKYFLTWEDHSPTFTELSLAEGWKKYEIEYNEIQKNKKIITEIIEYFEI